MAVVRLVAVGLQGVFKKRIIFVYICKIVCHTGVFCLSRRGKIWLRRRKDFMLKVVVFDGGYGGELFADKLEEELPVIEVIRVIDWRNADKLLLSAKDARRVAKEALRPYIGRVDLIVFANHLLTATSLNYFRRKYSLQKFVGLELKEPDTFINRETLILTTKAVIRTTKFFNYLLKLKRNCKTLALDEWPNKIDDGELDTEEIRNVLSDFMFGKKFYPKEVILLCAQFCDVKNEIRNVVGNNTRIYDSFDDCVRNVCKALRLKGGAMRRCK